MKDRQFSIEQVNEAKLAQKLISDVDYIKHKVDLIEGNLESNYVTIDQFTPVKNIVYGLVGLILSTVFVALIGLIIIKR